MCVCVKCGSPYIPVVSRSLGELSVIPVGLQMFHSELDSDPGKFWLWRKHAAEHCVMK